MSKRIFINAGLDRPEPKLEAVYCDLKTRHEVKVYAPQPNRAHLTARYRGIMIKNGRRAFMPQDDPAPGAVFGYGSLLYRAT